MTCAWCEEEVTAQDMSPLWLDRELWHPECRLRSLIGSAAHQLGICSCYVSGADETDPPELTKRQAARLAVQLWRQAREREAKGFS